MSPNSVSALSQVKTLLSYESETSDAATLFVALIGRVIVKDSPATTSSFDVSSLRGSAARAVIAALDIIIAADNAEAKIFFTFITIISSC